MGMSGVYGSSTDRESIETIHRSLDLGITFFDTADAYGAGHNEELLGKSLKGHRDRAVIATKFGLGRVGGILESGQSLPVSGKPEYVRSACEASLRRLDVDVIDLYYQHRVDPHTPIEETIGAMAELVKEGKVRFLGLSEAGVDTIRKAHTIHPITALQSEYSLWSRDVEDRILPTCQELGIGFVPWSPLGRGFLTGQIKTFDDLAIDDWRRNSPRFQGENFQLNLDLVEQIKIIAQAKQCTPSQLAIAWLLKQNEHIVPIPGTKRISYLKENIGALEVELSDQDLRKINQVMPQGVAAGDRYAPALMAMVNL